MKLSIVVPCYNEEEALPETIRKLRQILESVVSKGKADADSEILFVDDGSRDATWALIESSAAEHKNVHGIKLSRNQGHQIALIAGLHAASGDAIVSVDADLQDDVDVIERMVDFYHHGHDIVYGVRDDRTSDTFFKKASAELYYKLLKLMGVDVVFNHADFRLLSRRAMECLRSYEEVNMFLRGIIPLLGFRSAEVTYARSPRVAGESKYPMKKMLALALNGVTSFSAFPLRIITVVGLLVFAMSTLIGLWALCIRLFSSSAVPGWASTVIPIYFIGGIQLLCIGIMGEYLSKIYAEVKRRPRYFIEKKA